MSVRLADGGARQPTGQSELSEAGGVHSLVALAEVWNVTGVPGVHVGMMTVNVSVHVPNEAMVPQWNVVPAITMSIASGLSELLVAVAVISTGLPGHWFWTSVWHWIDTRGGWMQVTLA